MVISKKDTTTKINIIIDGTNIEQVTKFMYLGHMITDDGRCEEEIKRRIAIARTTFSKMNKVLTSRKIPLNTRVRIIQCYVWSTLMYGAETWSISQKMQKRLAAFEMWTYRRMLKIPWTAKISNKDVLKQMKITKRLLPTIQTRKLKYFGHITRHSSLQRMLLEGKVNGRRGRGRPRATWITDIAQWTGLKYAAAVRTADDREKWRTIASNPQQKDGTPD
jgi:hypothetical protein